MEKDNYPTFCIEYAGILFQTINEMSCPKCGNIGTWYLESKNPDGEKDVYELWCWECRQKARIVVNNPKITYIKDDGKTETGKSFGSSSYCHKKKV